MSNIIHSVLDLWRTGTSAYSIALEQHPILTEMTTSGLLWCIGDIITQYMERKFEQSSHEDKTATTTTPVSSNNGTCDLDHRNSMDNSKRINASSNTTTTLSSSFCSSMNWKRNWHQTLYASILWGPLAHQWYIYLDRLVHFMLTAHAHAPMTITSTEMALSIPNAVSALPPSSLHSVHGHTPSDFRVILLKFAIEMIFFHPVSLSIYFLALGWLDGIALRHILKDLRRDFMTTYAFVIAFWVPVDLFNFAFIPVHHQLLVVNFACLVDAIVLSYIKHNGTDQIKYQIMRFWLALFGRSKKTKCDLTSNHKLPGSPLQQDDIDVEELHDTSSDSEDDNLISEDNVSLIVKRRTQ